jgi:Ca-activated chloride channel family protein
MEGEPLANAKAAAAQLVDQLSSTDAFTVITYSSGVETVVPMTRATADTKAAARTAIAQIYDEGNTCISCGIEQGAAELSRSPVIGGLSRMVLISDGQANSGLSDRNELAQLATETAARGVSISTVGVGLDFDEVTMTRLADVGHGHYYFVEDTANLAAMFHQELDGMTETVAADVRLVVQGINANVLEAYGYPIVRGREDVVIPVADLRAGETRKVVLRVHIPTAETGSLEVARFTLDWRRVSDGRADQARTNLVTTLTKDLRDVAATIDRNAVNAIETARTARVLEDAAHTYETQGVEAAQRVIDRHMREVRDNKYIDAPAAQAIERASTGASSNFAKSPPAKAMKATRMDAYDLAR